MRKEDEFNVVKITNEDENLSFEFGNTPNSESASYKDNSDSLRDEINDNPTSNGTKRIKKEEKRRRKDESTKKDSKPSPESSISSSTATVSTVVGASLVSVATLSTIVGINVFFNGKCNMNIVEPSTHSIFYELDLTDIKDDKCIIKLEHQSYNDSHELVEGSNSGEFIDLSPKTEYHISVIDITYNNYVLFEDDVSTKEEIIPPAVTYTVTFISNGGTEIPSQIVNPGDTVVQPDDPTKENYYFAGWFSDSEFTEEYDFETPVMSDISLYAKWEIMTYFVAFFSNGGSEVSSQTVPIGETVVKPDDPTKENYSFMGWFSDSDLTTEYDFSAPVHSDLYLYAKWEEIPMVAISFEANGGTGEMATDYQYLGKEYILPECTLTAPNGCVFDCWQISSDESQYQPGEGYLIQTTTSVTFIAVWAEAATVEFYPGIGATGSVTSLKVAIGKEYEIPSGEEYFTPPTNQEFDYWFDDMYSEQRHVGDVITIEDTYYSFTAHWKYLDGLTFTVTFDSNGGTEVASQTIECGGTVTKPTDPTINDGRIFAGWYIDEELSEEYDFTSEVVSSFVLYARWGILRRVTFVTGEGATEIDQQYVISGNLATKPDDPTRDNYEFAGWYTSDTYEEEFDFDTMVIEVDTSIYAKWSTTYSVSGEGFNGFPNSTVSYATESEINGVNLQVSAYSCYYNDPDDGHGLWIPLGYDSQHPEDCISYLANKTPINGSIKNIAITVGPSAYNGTSITTLHVTFGTEPMLEHLTSGTTITYDTDATLVVECNLDGCSYFNITNVSENGLVIESIVVTYYVN